MAYHILALLCNGTSGLYFLYGRFRVIISIDSRSSITLKYWKTKQTAYYSEHETNQVSFWNENRFYIQKRLRSEFIMLIILINWFSFYHITYHFRKTICTCGLLNSTVISCKLTSKSIFGDEKSTSDRGFIRSLALAVIGRNTKKQKLIHKVQLSYLRLL